MNNEPENTKYTLKELFHRLDKLDTDIENIAKSFQELKSDIQNDLKPACSKMVHHVDFIDEVYEKVKVPLNYVCNKINRIIR